MRIAAGVLMIIVGFYSIALVEVMAEVIVRVAMVNPSDPNETLYWIAFYSKLLPPFILGGAICAFIHRAYWWALSGAIFSIFISTFTSVISPWCCIFLIMAILALIFLIKRKGEFQA